MTQGPGRFEYFLLQLEGLLQQASQSENVALFLFENDARTKLFMLEGLSKLYTGLHNKKIFKYTNDHFKLLEDALGEVDYYDGYAKDFLADNEMPATIRLFMEEKKAEKLGDLNTLLLKKKLIGHDPSRIKKIRKKLQKADWKKPEEEMQLIKLYYAKEIEDINHFYKSTGSDFIDIEAQVHDLRRKLRWLSIYPQALRGAVQLADSGVKDDLVVKYLTPAVINSPFNVMPGVANNDVILTLEKNYFLALSNMISALGKIKDKGLRLVATSEAVRHTQFVTDEVALQSAIVLNHAENGGVSHILKEAKEICEPFFVEDNLGKLVSLIVTQN